MPEFQPLNSLDFSGGIEASSPQFTQTSRENLSDESWNSIVSGNGFTRGFNGPTTQGASTGSRKMLTVGNTWGGIKDIGGTQGSGSFFQDKGKSRWGIGAGQPHIEGADVSGFVLSTLLQVSVKSSGVYAAPVQAGLAQPSAPDIGIISTVGDVTNPVSCKIERRRPSTGARSVASPTSAVINPQSNRVRVTFPTAATGQTHWRVYFTFQGFGGTGVHYLAKYSTYTDIPETVVSAGTVDSISRSLEFNFKDGDLVPFEASYDDYAPSAATHALRLESVMCLAGANADAVTDPTSANPGTTIDVSKPNNYESYVPTHKLFLPESVTDVLSRPIDDFGYVACETSVHVVQFVGYRGDELPACTISTILPDIGVQYPHNWTHFRGRLVIFAAEGNLLMMSETGEFQPNFAAPITKIIQNWTPADTIVGYCPKNDLIIVANGKRILCYSIAANVWRQIWLPDFGVTGNVLSCTTAKRRLYITVDNAGSRTAYSFDTNTQTAPLSFVTNWQDAPTGTGFFKDLSEIVISSETGASSTQLAIMVAKNLNKSVFRRIGVAASSGSVTDADSSFYAGMVGKKVIIFADGINGGGTILFQGKVSAFANSGQITIVNQNGTAWVASVTASELLMFCGEYSEAKSISNQAMHFPNFIPNVTEARSYKIAVWMQGANNIGNVTACEAFGLTYPASRAR